MLVPINISTDNEIKNIDLGGGVRTKPELNGSRIKFKYWVRFISKQK